MPGFKEGELILSCTPYSYVLSDEFKNQFCDFCFKENNQLKKCARCAFAYYCDKNCQTKAWDLHQTECKYLKNYNGMKPITAIRELALIILKIKKHGVDKPFINVDARKVSFATLMSHAEDIKQNPKRKKFVEYSSLILQQYIGPDNTPSFNELTEIVGKTNINSFGILDMMATKYIGRGLYLGASVFDHSCDPDASVVFDGTTLNVRMKRNVSHLNVSEVHITYVDNFLPLTEERQRVLLENYFFHCECERCTSSERNDLMTKLLSDTDEAKQKALACQIEFKEKGKSLEKLVQTNPHYVLEECKKLLKAQSEVFADSNIYKFKTMQIVYEVFYHLNATEDLIKMASCLEKYFRLYYGNVNLDLGNFLLGYGQHLCLAGNKEEGASKLSESDNIFKIIFGTQHPCYKDFKNVMNHSLPSTVTII